MAILSFKKKTRKKKPMLHVGKGSVTEEGYAVSANLLEKMKGFPGDFQNVMTMDEGTYLHLLSLVTPLISKQPTVMRTSERLTITLGYLTGRRYQDRRF